MKTQAIVPAVVDFDGPDGVPVSPRFGDRYHARAGAFEQAQHVFLAGNGLPGRWSGRERFVVLETGFGLGHNFLATWAAWRADPRRCARLDFVSVERHPLSRTDLQRAHRASPEPALAAELVAQWPPPTHNLHLRQFNGGNVSLLLAFGDVRSWLPELVLQADAVFLDGFAPAANPAMWSREVLKAIGRLAAPGATVATWSAAAQVRDGLRTAGFEVTKARGLADKRVMTVGRHAPRVSMPAPPGRPRARDPAGGPPGTGGVLIIGAGLAGAAAARALADLDVDCTVVDAACAPARGASGNPGGLFHPTVHADDGPHARWHRAAALHAHTVLAPHLARGALPGGVAGLLRLESVLDRDAMLRRIVQLGLPADFVQALDAQEAAQRSGLPPTLPAWYYPGGGWIDPAAWVAVQLDHSRIRLRTGVRIDSLRRTADRWQALDAAGGVVAEAPRVVMAAGRDLPRLAAWAERTGLALRAERGQITRVPAAFAAAAPRLPVSGEGYVLALPGGDLLCGATSHAGDEDGRLRAADTRRNVERLVRIAGPLRPDAAVATFGGRVGWRLHGADRLPVIGPLPLIEPAGETLRARRDHPRFIAREPGLYVLGALGSRGIASSLLGGAIVAAWITGAPMPVESSLLDAVDPARALARRARRRASEG